MKKNQPSLVIIIGIMITLLFTIVSCQTENDGMIGTETDSGSTYRNNANSAVYPPSSNPLGKSHQLWAQNFWHAAYSLDCNGINSSQILNLDNNVIAFWANLENTSIDITISRDKAIFLPIVTVLYDYPCPSEFEFEPEEGQSLEDFLRMGAAASIDEVENIQVTLDGVELENLNNYRFVHNLFYFTGNPELTGCWDPCITGQSQAGVTDGYFVMFKKLSVGQHTISTHGEIPGYDIEWNLTFNITVQ